MGIGVGTLPRDDNGVAVLGLWNDATGKPIPAHVGATVTGADGNTYGKLDVDVTVSVDPANPQPVSAANGTFVAGAISDLSTLPASLAELLGDTDSLASSLTQQTNLNTVLGTTADTAYSDRTGAAAGTLEAILKGLFAKGFLVVDSAGTNKLAIDASGRLTLVPNQTFELVDSAGTNKAAVDSAGRQLINVGQIGGQTPTLDNTTIQAVSMRGKGAGTAGDTAMLLDSSGRPMANIAQWNGATISVTNPVIDQDQIRAWILAGNAFSLTTGLISSATNANLWGGIQIYANNIAKDVFIYFIDVYNITISGDTEIRTNSGASSADAGLNGASPPAPVSTKIGSGLTSLVTVNWTANNFTAGSSQPGTLQWQGAAAANAHQYPINIPADGFYLPKNTQVALEVLSKLPTAGQTYAITIRYVEY